MPIIGMQRKLREAGRIRIGEQVKSSNGKMHPSKLEVFRFTSADKQTIDAVAQLCGGEVRIWQGAPVGEQYELYSECKSFDVIISHTDLAFSQWYELWNGGGCVRRCDGETNVLTEQPCLCDPDNLECSPTTRLSVILADLEGIGQWRLETHGWNAASELLGTIEVIKNIQARNKGAMIPARLMLQQRQSKKDGKTFNYVVPSLDLKVSVAALTSGVSDNTPRLASGVTPIQQEEPPMPTVAEQLHVAEVPRERVQRSNSAAPLPSTGLDPRGGVKTTGDDRIPGGALKSSQRKLFAMLNGHAELKSDTVRLEWASAQTTRDVASFNDLTQDEVLHLQGVLKNQPVTATEYADGEEPF